ncbi:MAG: hypothetical protein ACREOU_04615 [Candidatus Eiseniibacteriota bacterium]
MNRRAKEERGGARKHRTPAEVRADERRKSAAGTEPKAGTRWSRSPLFWASVVYFLVMAVVFQAVIFGGQTFVSPDTTAPLGFVRVGEESLWKHGVYPLWNPYVFAGMPSFASGAYNPLIYPPDWPVALVQKILPLPDVSWMLLYYFLAGLGTFVLARSWGATPAAAMVAGVAFMITPNLVANGAHGHGSQMVNEAYLPWMLWLASRVWQGGRIQDVATLALLVGFQLLRGHIQIAYYTWLVIGLYSLFELGRRAIAPGGIREAAGRVAMLGGAMALGFALSSFFSLPIRAYAEHSIRAAGEGGGLTYAYATNWSFSPVEMFTFLVPGALGFGGATYWGTMPFTDFPNYMGLAILACAFLAIAAGRHRFFVSFLLVLSAFVLLVSFGKHGGLYDFLFHNLPYFNKFRVPVMILIVLQLATAVLAAFGLSAFEEAVHDERLRKRMFLWTGLVTAAVALFWLSGLVGDTWSESYAKAAHASRPDMPAAAIDAGSRAMRGDLVRVGFLALLALSTLLASLRGIGRPAWAAAAVGIVTLVDLAVVDYRLMAPVLGPPRQIAAGAERDDVVDFLVSKKTEGEFRIFPVREFQSNRYAGFAIASLGGYHAAKPRRYQTFLDADSGRAASSPAAWRLLNVRYIVYPGLLPETMGFVEAFRGQQQVVYEFPGALPRATLVPTYRVATEDEQLRAISDPAHDAALVTLLDQPPGVEPVPGGSVRIVEYGLNRVRLESDTPGPALIRLSDLAFPGWEVRVDGQEAKALIGDYLCRVVAVPAGKHAIAWEFKDPALARGLAISLAALAVILALYLVPLVRARMRRATPAS